MEAISLSNRTRAELVAAVTAAARRHHAAYTLFNQAMAERLGLHPTDLQCLSLLGLEPGPHTTGDIAKLTGLTSGSATRLVDRLEKAGLAERRPDTHDRRKMLVSLTAQRGPELETAWEGPGRAFDQALDDFTDDELAVIERYLRRTTEVGTEQTAHLRGG
ncbi:MarR family winged helix-turn-helix transcriptional regulator [Nonomuraea gerenzanensis]|uniref:Transcriptional regulator, MarR family n=1 Tax=Nonomuraea gerenzanensis TaxID=93944 RepID=A0A1M4EC46_9ACTN|nr:MarR family transcriptional regulator [Nonomuraea gerenzanensis]UBU18496.1 MarR family transcriptional regulator [Nonomuraea gerenzanensis]SBO96336.1 Transcriptional regulator, MarR family [Nonomuraea gerenzanensis]